MNSNLENPSRAEFFSIFSARFDADLIDITDKRALENGIRACAFDTLQRVEDVQAVVFYLERILENWNGQNIAPFIEATNLDWLFDDQTEQSLRFIIQAITWDLWSSGALHPSP